MRWNGSGYNAPSELLRYGTLSIALLVGICCSNVDAATEQVLHRFQAGKDGATPIGGLVEDASGNLYGTTANGGPSDHGTVFQLSPPKTPGGAWKESVLYAFKLRNDGSEPAATLILDEAGNLYGTTFSGGLELQCFDCGTVFELVRPPRPGAAWTEKILHSFGGTDGSLPNAGLFRDANGNLYGTTFVGGAARSGTVFELIPPVNNKGAWTENVLYAFTGGVDGNTPAGRVVRGPDGALYGTTNLGGANSMGAIYRLAPPAVEGGSWSESVIYSFAGGSDGDLPGAGVLFDRQGRLYGTASFGGSQICASGCGTVFQLTPPASETGTWSEKTLHEFNGDDGAQPLGDLTFGPNGLLYGTASSGGPVSLTCPGNCGTVFQLAPPALPQGEWRETTLYFFTTAGDGHGPEAGVIRDPQGPLYGVTAVAGDSAVGGIGGGTVFEIRP